MIRVRLLLGPKCLHVSDALRTDGRDQGCICQISLGGSKFWLLMSTTVLMHRYIESRPPWRSLIAAGGSEIFEGGSTPNPPRQIQPWPGLGRSASHRSRRPRCRTGQLQQLQAAACRDRLRVSNAAPTRPAGTDSFQQPVPRIKVGAIGRLTIATVYSPPALNSRQTKCSAS